MFKTVRDIYSPYLTPSQLMEAIPFAKEGDKLQIMAVHNKSAILKNERTNEKFMVSSKVVPPGELKIFKSMSIVKQIANLSFSDYE